MFVTSADSTCESIDECISKGSKIPMTYRKLMWIFIMCIFITILMICGNGSMDAIYGISYLTAPLIVILIIGSLIYVGIKIIKNHYEKNHPSDK